MDHDDRRIIIMLAVDFALAALVVVGCAFYIMLNKGDGMYLMPWLAIHAIAAVLLTLSYIAFRADNRPTQYLGHMMRSSWFSLVFIMSAASFVSSLGDKFF